MRMTRVLDESSFSGLLHACLIACYGHCYDYSIQEIMLFISVHRTWLSIIITTIFRFLYDLSS